MNATDQNNEERNSIDQELSKEASSVAEVNPAAEAHDEDSHDPGKKKYHSSAMYAASKLHEAVGHVRPRHTGIDL